MVRVTHSSTWGAHVRMQYVYMESSGKQGSHNILIIDIWSDHNTHKYGEMHWKRPFTMPYDSEKICTYFVMWSIGYEAVFN